MVICSAFSVCLVKQKHIYFILCFEICILYKHIWMNNFCSVRSSRSGNLSAISQLSNRSLSTLFQAYISSDRLNLESFVFFFSNIFIFGGVRGLLRLKGLGLRLEPDNDILILDLRCYIVKLRIQGCRYWV